MPPTKKGRDVEAELRATALLSQRLLPDACLWLTMRLSDHIWLVTFMHDDLGYFDDETCRLEPNANPFGPNVLPTSSGRVRVSRSPRYDVPSL